MICPRCNMGLRMIDEQMAREIFVCDHCGLKITLEDE